VHEKCKTYVEEVFNKCPTLKNILYIENVFGMCAKGVQEGSMSDTGDTGMTSW